MSLRYAVLALLEHESMTGYEMAGLFDASVSYFWSARHQQIYRELRDMTERGWVRFERIELADRPDSKRYAITDSGHQALIDWVETPLAETAPKEPVLLKLLAAPAVPRASLLAEFDRQHEQIEQRLAAYQEIAACHYDPPPDLDRPLDRHAVLYLSLSLGISSARAYRDWLRRTRRWLAGEPAARS